MVLKWLRSAFSSSKRLVGVDSAGNKYFEYLRSSGRVQRSVESSLKHEDYSSNSIPQEWQGWMSGQRDDPPTVEEIEKRQQVTKIIQHRASVKLIEDNKNQEKAFADGLIARESHDVNSPAEEAKARQPNKRYFDKQQHISPQSPVGEYTPNKPAYQPEAWTPGGNGRGGGGDA